ncbi:MAG: DUF5684 domain-containing protein [Bacillota bacterium]|nr:DUF5684 domain-containing protein [Bacillota bacterium]
MTAVLIALTRGTANSEYIEGIDVGQQDIRVILFGLAIACLVYLLVSVVTLWRIYRKAGEPGWAILIPIYNAYVLFKITWGSGWYFLLMFIPLVNIVVAFMTLVKLSRAFGHGGGFALGLILLHLLFMLILAFGGSRYLGVPGRDA